MRRGSVLPSLDCMLDIDCSAGLDARTGNRIATILLVVREWIQTSQW